MQSDMRIELFDIENCAIEELFIIIIIIIILYRYCMVNAQSTAKSDIIEANKKCIPMIPQVNNSDSLY